MSREYARVHEFYLHLHDLQPPAHNYHHHYDLPHTHPSATQVYEMTADDSGGGGDGEGGVCDSTGALVAAHALHQLHPPMHQPLLQHHQHHQQHQHHDQHKRKNTHYGPEAAFEIPVCEPPLAAPLAVPPAPAAPSAPPEPSFVAPAPDEAHSTVPAPASAPRKRKSSSFGTASAYDDDGGDDPHSSRMLPDKKQNHSEIEKRRRDKMNTYISELSAMVPMCGAMARKLDKLTVLRMAVQHLRSVRGALSACPLSARPRPAFLSERELNALVLHAAHDCFLLVVGCDRGRLLYVSASVKTMLQYEQSELLGQSLFDILHPKDVAKVKEQLSSSDLSPRERLIDAKTMLPVKSDVVTGASRLCPGARRSFFCRIKCKAPPEPHAPHAPTAPTAMPVKEETDNNAKIRKKQIEKKYCVVQCTGYLKSWAPVEISEGVVSSTEGGEEGEACNLSCLVAVGRALVDLAPSSPAATSATAATAPPAPRTSRVPPAPPTRHLQYVSRHTTDGKFLFVDQRVTLALGFLPQELLGTSLYEYVAGPELGAVARTHKAALLQRDALHTPPYSFRRKDGSLARIHTHFKPLKNPWTKDVECLVANNTVLSDSNAPAQPDDQTEATYDMFKQTQRDGGEDGAPPGHVASALSEADIEMQRLIDSQVESHKIGSAIAEEALRRSSTEFSPDLPADLPADLLTDVVFTQQNSLVDNLLGVDLGGYAPVRNNVTLSAAGAADSPPPTAAAPAQPPGTPPPASPPLPPLGIDGNGEAAMAVIMSLLEADAGLGGPVNFSGLPWPLP